MRVLREHFCWLKETTLQTSVPLEMLVLRPKLLVNMEAFCILFLGLGPLHCLASFLSLGFGGEAAVVGFSLLPAGQPVTDPTLHPYSKSGFIRHFWKGLSTHPYGSRPRKLRVPLPAELGHGGWRQLSGVTC